MQMNDKPSSWLQNLQFLCNELINLLQFTSSGSWKIWSRMQKSQQTAGRIRPPWLLQCRWNHACTRKHSWVKPLLTAFELHPKVSLVFHCLRIEKQRGRIDSKPQGLPNNTISTTMEFSAPRIVWMFRLVNLFELGMIMHAINLSSFYDITTCKWPSKRKCFMLPYEESWIRWRDSTACRKGQQW